MCALSGRGRKSFGRGGLYDHIGNPPRVWHLSRLHGAGEDIGFDYYRRSLAAVREAHRAYSHGGTTSAEAATTTVIEGPSW